LPNPRNASTFSGIHQSSRLSTLALTASRVPRGLMKLD